MYIHYDRDCVDIHILLFSLRWCDSDTVMFCSCSGPIVLLRLELGVLSRGCVGPVELVCEYLRLGDVAKVNWSACI